MEKFLDRKRNNNRTQQNLDVVVYSLKVLKINPKSDSNYSQNDVETDTKYLFSNAHVDTGIEKLVKYPAATTGWNVLLRRGKRRC